MISPVMPHAGLSGTIAMTELRQRPQRRQDLDVQQWRTVSQDQRAAIAGTGQAEPAGTRSHLDFCCSRDSRGIVAHSPDNGTADHPHWRQHYSRGVPGAPQGSDRLSQLADCDQAGGALPTTLTMSDHRPTARTCKAPATGAFCFCRLSNPIGICPKLWQPFKLADEDGHASERGVLFEYS